MKKTIFGLIMITAMLAFTACGSERKSDEGSTEVLAGQSDNTATNEKADIKTDAKADTANEELEKLQLLGTQNAGKFCYKEALLRGEIEKMSKRITLSDAKKIISENSGSQSIIKAFEEFQPVPDFSGGSGITRYEYWLDDDGDEKIVVYIEQFAVWYSNEKNEVFELLTDAKDINRFSYEGLELTEKYTDGSDTVYTDGHYDYWIKSNGYLRKIRPVNGYAAPKVKSVLEDSKNYIKKICPEIELDDNCWWGTEEDTSEDGAMSVYCECKLSEDSLYGVCIANIHYGSENRYMRLEGASFKLDMLEYLGKSEKLIDYDSIVNKAEEELKAYLEKNTDEKVKSYLTYPDDYYMQEDLYFDSDRNRPVWEVSYNFFEGDEYPEEHVKKYICAFDALTGENYGITIDFGYPIDAESAWKLAETYVEEYIENEKAAGIVFTAKELSGYYTAACEMNSHGGKDYWYVTFRRMDTTDDSQPESYVCELSADDGSLSYVDKSK